MSSQQRLVLTVAILASFVAFLDGSVVNVALPAINRQLGGGLSLQQWVVDAYLITMGSLMLVAGSFSDLFGRVKILRLGLLGFAAGSLLCALAPSGLFLILARGLQGMAGALLVPSSLAIIISAFKGAAQGKAIGSWTAWTGIAFVIGPLLGGYLVDNFSWRWIFAINLLPIAIVLILLQKVEQTVRPKLVPIDWGGVGLCVVGLGGAVYALIEQASRGWSNPTIWGPLLVGLIALAWFVWYESRQKQPMLPLALFKVRNFSVGNIATVFIYGALGIATFLIVIFLQQSAGYSAIQAGLALLPTTILMFFLSSRFGLLASRRGPRLFMTIGPLVAGVGFLSMLRVEAGAHYWSQLFPGILLFGLGLSITVAPLTSAILGAIDSSQAGIGSAVNNAVARIAGLVTIAGLALVTGPTLNLAAFHRGVVALAALMIIGGLVSWAGITNSALPAQDPASPAN